jgi:hypothetical protein
MLSAHPGVFAFIFLVIAMLAHFAGRRYSPIERRTNSETSWFVVKDKLELNQIMMFKLLLATKWAAVGLLLSMLLV